MAKKKKFIVRWNLKPKRRGWITAMKGEEVSLENQLYTEEWGCGTPLVKTADKNIGFAPPHFLKNYAQETELKNPHTLQTQQQRTKVSPEIESGKWWIGECGPLEAAEHLRNDPKLSAGTFVVCQPPEFYEHMTHPELLTLVRLYTGSEDKMEKDWEQERLRRQATFAVGGEAQALPPPPTRSQPVVKCDTLPASRAPIPLVGYLRIQRQQHNGEYFFFNGDDSFLTVHELLAAYKDQPLQWDFNVAVSLTVPPSHNNESEGPRPPYFLEPARKRKENKGALAYAPLPGARLSATPKLIGRGYYGNTKIGTMEEKKQTDKKNEQPTITKLALKTIRAACDEYRKVYNTLCNLQSDGIHGRYLLPWLFVDGVKIPQKSNVNKELICLCAQFAEHGTLNNHLKARKTPLKLRVLLEILYQITSAMTYLEYMELYHLAMGCRNIVVTNASTHCVHVAVNDFYMPALRLIRDKTYIRRKKLDRLPWRWMALESLEEGEFDITSDVWAFAVVMFEVFTHCQQKPYANIRSPTALINFLRAGRRMDCPEGQVPSYMQAVMHDCWATVPASRPTFYTLLSLFQRLLFDSVGSPCRAIRDYEINVGNKTQQNASTRAPATLRRRTTIDDSGRTSTIAKQPAKLRAATEPQPFGRKLIATVETTILKRGSSTSVQKSDTNNTQHSSKSYRQFKP